MVVTIGIKLFKAVLWFQAELNFADNIKIVIIFIEKKNIEIEIAILTSKSNLNNIGRANGILEVCYREELLFMVF